LKIDGRGNAFQGLLVRHLVLPENKANSREIIKALSVISPQVPLSLMAQYRPCFKAGRVPEINRPLTSDEYQAISAFAEQMDLEEIFIQELDSADHYYPDFDREHPFFESSL
jgi:putative pyruvate formate lyase activating enzyme